MPCAGRARCDAGQDEAVRSVVQRGSPEEQALLAYGVKMLPARSERGKRSMWQQQVASAEATRDGALRIAALAVSLMTDDQKMKLRDSLVCLQLEEGL